MSIARHYPSHPIIPFAVETDHAVHRYGQPDEAMRYLDQAWESRFEHDRLELLDKVYVQTGDRQQLKAIRSRLF